MVNKKKLGIIFVIIAVMTVLLFRESREIIIKNIDKISESLASKFVSDEEKRCRIALWVVQAMTVALINKKGKIDTIQITVAYVGTNFEDSYDRATDMDNVILGLNKLPLKEITIDSQFTTALGYADYIKKKYPETKISVTGHSLGGSLALTVGAKRKLHTVAFNGPIPQG